MAEIAPFRALRFNPQRVPDLRDVVTPPYDVISPAAQQEYYARHPLNVIRLVLARDRSDELPGLDRYQAAATTFSDWRHKGVLVQDPEPGIYVYEQVFEVAGQSHRRRGMLALLRLAEYGHGVVFPHERTFPRHKDDRLKLMQACPAHLESILAFYPQLAPSLSALFDQCMHEDPLARVIDHAGTRHQLWSMVDATGIATAVEAVRNQPVIIADGHHRYETALNYRNERATMAAARAPEQFVLVNLVAGDDPGLLILPTHRLVHGPVPADIESRVQRQFAVERVPIESATQVQGMLATADAASFLLYSGEGRALRIRTKTAQSSSQWPDADILHQQILSDLLEIGGEPERLSYTHSAGEAMQAVDAGRAALACFMAPPSVAQVQAVALAGGRMPQKSTYFYPKVLSGLVIHPIDADDRVPQV